MNNFLNILEQYHNDGLLYKQTHPSLPLTIWNYSEKAQYGELWDEVTLQCRGLVTDNEGNIVARPFKKFFNLEEKKHIPTEEFEVFEKMDGSLGILFNYEGEWILATRGSFTSSQSVKGKEIFDHYVKEYGDDNLNVNLTYLVEILFPENRIVVDYGKDEKLILLGITDQYGETHYSHFEYLWFHKDLIVKKYDGIRDYSELKSKIEQNAEGFVVRFSNGDRMKIKGYEYLRLHKIMTNVSTTSIWEYLSSNGDINELLKDVPDEFYKKVKQYKGELKYAYYQVSEYCGKYHDSFRYGKYGDRAVEPTKKEFAEFVMKQLPKPYHSVMFAMWDKKPYDKIIWDIIKPKFKKL
jgi:RNA ligase